MGVRGTPYRRYTEEQILRAAETYRNGATAKEAGALIGMSGSRMGFHLRRLGIPRRQAGDYASFPRGSAHYAWKVEGGKRDAMRSRAQRAYSLEGVACEHCGERPAIDRHHIDDNTANNERSNIALLCRRCHMTADGRLERNLAAGRPGPQPAKSCVVCERLYKPMRRGHCARCYDQVFRPDRWAREAARRAT